MPLEGIRKDETTRLRTPGAEETDLDPAELLRRQSELLAFIESISSELELRPLLDRILMHACHLIGADDGTIGLVDPSGPLVRIEAAWCMGPDEVGSEYARGEGLAGHVLEINEPVILEHYSDLPSPIAKRDNAVIGLPIRRGDAMIGFFGIGRVSKADDETATPFDAADVDTLQVFARHAAVAIENARRYLREQERGERLELIAQIGTLITADFRPQETLQEAADAIHDLLGYQNIGIGVVHDDEPPFIVIEAMAGQFKEQIPKPFALPLTEGIMGACARQRSTIRVDDVHADPRYVPAPGVLGIRCLISVPILVGDEVFGVLNVESDEPFDDEDSWSLRIVADQLAVAMQNARLYAQAQEGAAATERQRIARELHDSVTQHLFGTVMLTESLPAVWERDPEKGKQRANRVLDLARAALGEMRALLAELRPGGPLTPPDARATFGAQRVRSQGLESAIDQLASEVSSLGVPVRFRTSDYRPHDFPMEEALYRITQEALNNAAKHSSASEVTVHLTSDDSGVRLVVADDGRGMNLSSPADRTGGRGMGLTSMRERASAVGGQFELTTQPGEGVRVEVHIPNGDAERSNGDDQ